MKERYDRLKSDEILSKIGFHENNPFYLETVFRTNTISAYNAGRWEEIQRNKENIAFLEYVAIDDSRTSEICSALDGVRLPPDDPFWKTHYPPNHFNCRLQVIEVSPDEAEVFGYKETDKDKIEIPELPKGFDTPIDDAWWDLSSSMADRVNKYDMKELLLEKAKDLCKDKKFSDDKDGFCEDYFKVKNKLDGKKDDNIKMNNDVEKANEIFDKFLEKYNSVDKNNIETTFKNLFENESKYQEHLNRRIGFGHINKNNPAKDYFNKTIDCIKKCDIIILEEYKKTWQKLYFDSRNEWIVILDNKGFLVTSYALDQIEKQMKIQNKKSKLGLIQKEVIINEDLRRKIKTL